MYKKLIALLFLAMPAFGMAQNTQIKLGYLDVQTLFLAMPEVSQIETSLKDLAAQHEGEIKRMEDEYNRKLTEYKDGEAKWDEAIKKNRMEEIQMLQMKVQQYYQSAQTLLQQKQEELQAPIREKLRKAIEEVGAENGFLYIYDLNTLLYKSGDAIDVTPLLKKKLNIK
ncbi:MAG: OmpH family outer membrane protein [Paludibacteraceae bacterium]|nr:OmpH family outer membrane protein [Paludibacteraceae bacterium]MBO7608463.1 OmpH family outer membrane protein [Paludibacteraceae bacterium]